MMQIAAFDKLVMLGAAPETRGSIASADEAYRAHGLFRRWPVEYIPTHSGAGLLDSARVTAQGLRAFARLVGRHRRVVLHAHCTPRAGFWREGLFMAVAAAARCPVILQLHGGGFQPFYDSASTPVRWAIRFFLERAACVVAASESQRAWARSVTREAHVLCVPPPIQPIDVDPAAKLEARPNLILFLGRLEADKGIFDLLEAVAALRPAVPDVRLVCAGEGNRRAVQRFAERLGIRDAVKFTGWVGASGKRALLETAAVFALPSYAEGLPAGLLEAQLAGIPVVASPVGGVPDAVVHEVTGLLVAPGDRSALARSLRKLLLDRACAARIGAAARQSALARFSPERTIARLEEIYADAGLASLQEPAAPRVQPQMRQAA